MNVEKLIEKLSECLDEGENLLGDISISGNNDIMDVTGDRIGCKIYDNRTGRAFWTITFTTQSDERITHNLEESKKR